MVSILVYGHGDRLIIENPEEATPYEFNGELQVPTPWHLLILRTRDRETEVLYDWRQHRLDSHSVRMTMYNHISSSAVDANHEKFDALMKELGEQFPDPPRSPRVRRTQLESAEISEFAERLGRVIDESRERRKFEAESDSDPDRGIH